MNRMKFYRMGANGFPEEMIVTLGNSKLSTLLDPKKRQTRKFGTPREAEIWAAANGWSRKKVYLTIQKPVSALPKFDIQGRAACSST